MNAQNLFLIFGCMTIGAILKKSGRFPDQTPTVLNAFVIWISLPALVLSEIPRSLTNTSLDGQLLIPISMAWILFAIAVAAFNWFIPKNHLPKNAIGALTLTAGLGNTSFVGFPIIESLHGKHGLGTAMLCDQLGTFLVLSTAGILYATRQASSDTAAPRKILTSVITFPPFAAMLTATLIWIIKPPIIAPVSLALERLASTLIPVALVAVGFQLRLSRTEIIAHWRPVSYGLVFKLLLAPLIFTLGFRIVLNSQSLATQITILESAMAPMITAGVVAEEFGFDREIASLMIGIGIPISLITVPLWNTVLTAIGFTA